MAQLVSDPSNLVTVTPQPTSAWIKDPADPSRNLPVFCADNIAWTRNRAQAVLSVLGRPDPVVQSDVRRTRTGTLTVTPLSQQEANALDALLDSPGVLLVQTPVPQLGWWGQSAYVVLTGDDTSTPLGKVPVGSRDTAVGLTEVRRP